MIKKGYFYLKGWYKKSHTTWLHQKRLIEEIKEMSSWRFDDPRIPRLTPSKDALKTRHLSASGMITINPRMWFGEYRDPYENE